jgi:hypothetical protein
LKNASKILILIHSSKKSECLINEALGMAQ